jgi:HEAT repeat protein
MAENGNHPEIRVAEVRRRVPGSGPILLLATLFVAATFLAWYFSWFGRELSDADISKYLLDEKKPRHVQHALLQIQQRIERGDSSAKNWYPQLLVLSGNPETEFRLTVAWLMGFDNRSQEFHDALLKLLHDPEPIVRRNAALALVRFEDHSGREELASVLKPYALKAETDGVVESSLDEGATVARRTLLARIQQADGKVVELRSPLPGRIARLMKPNGAQVSRDEEVLSLNSDEQSVWEALRGLSLVGNAEDIQLVQSYADSGEVSTRIKEQARLTVEAIHRLHR